MSFSTQIQKELETFAQKHKGLGKIKVGFNFPLDNTTDNTSVKIIPNQSLSAHQQVEMIIAQKEIEDSLKTSHLFKWATQCPILWQTCNNENPKNNMHSLVDITLERGRPSIISTYIPFYSIERGNKWTSQNAQARLLKDGSDLIRYFQILESMKGPFTTWETTYGGKEISFKGPRNGPGALILDRLFRSKQSTLRNMPKEKEKAQKLVMSANENFESFDPFDDIYA